MPTLRLPVTTLSPQAGKCVNVWHLRTPENSPVGDAALGGAVTALRAFYGSLLDQFPPGNTITADFAVDVVTGQDHAVTWATQTGTGITGTAPPHLAIVVGWKTGTRARRARGRTFLGPFGAAVLQADGTPLDSTLTKVRTAAQTLISASLTDNTWAFGVYGLANPAPVGYQGNYSELPHVFRDFQGAAVRDSWAVMRSRRPRV